MIFFGGSPDAPSNLNDVFWLENASSVNRYLSWQPVNPTGVRPAPRLQQSAVYDSANSRMIVFGGGLGRTSPCVNDVWVLSNANGAAGSPAWIRSNPTGAQPIPRERHTAVYDPNSNNSNRMIIFSGNDCFSTSYNDVWVLSNANGLTGTPAWTQLTPTGASPSARYGASAVYDPTSNIMIVYGGEASGTFPGDLWILSHANGIGGTPAWTQLTPSGPPPGRAYHSAVYDTASNRMTVFAGESNGFFSDAWVLSSANGIGETPAWKQLSPSGSVPPTPRGGHTAVYDPTSNVMTIFGGIIDSQAIPVSDVFALQHANGL